MIQKTYCFLLFLRDVLHLDHKRIPVIKYQNFIGRLDYDVYRSEIFQLSLKNHQDDSFPQLFEKRLDENIDFEDIILLPKHVIIYRKTDGDRTNSKTEFHQINIPCINKIDGKKSASK